MNIKFAVFTAILMLTACKSAPPIPSDKFYRLESVPAQTSASTAINESLYIAPLRADGPYAERAMLYAQQPRELQQYHYQFWSEPPAVLLQEHLRSSLQAMNFAPRVTDMPLAAGIGYLLNAKILRLEKINDNGQVRAVISLHFALQRKKNQELVLDKTYLAEEEVSDDTQHTYVLACEAGLKKIYTQFAADLKTGH